METVSKQSITVVCPLSLRVVVVVVSEQDELRKALILEDRFDWTVEESAKQLQRVAGMDISFVKDNNQDACASLIVMQFPSMEILYEQYKMVKLTKPYIPGFLAFREVSFLRELIDELRSKQPALLPQVVFIDGNGVLHPRGFGLACHLGVTIDIPTLGVAKTLIFVDGLSMDSVKPQFRAKCLHAGDSMDLIGDSGRVWGKALRSSADAPNPVFVSAGHRMNLTTALTLTQRCCAGVRVPEPIRQADLRSRAFIRDGKPPARDSRALQPKNKKATKPPAAKPPITYADSDDES